MSTVPGGARFCAALLMWAISAALIVAVNPQAALAAGPINLGRAIRPE
jgi:hypothetical protein